MWLRKVKAHTCIAYVSVSIAYITYVSICFEHWRSFTRCLSWEHMSVDILVSLWDCAYICMPLCRKIYHSSKINILIRYNYIGSHAYIHTCTGPLRWAPYSLPSNYLVYQTNVLGEKAGTGEDEGGRSKAREQLENIDGVQRETGKFKQMELETRWGKQVFCFNAKSCSDLSGPALMSNVSYIHFPLQSCFAPALVKHNSTRLWLDTTSFRIAIITACIRTVQTLLYVYASIMAHGYMVSHVFLAHFSNYSHLAGLTSFHTFTLSFLLYLEAEMTLRLKKLRSHEFLMFLSIQIHQ